MSFKMIVYLFKNMLINKYKMSFKLMNYLFIDYFVKLINKYNIHMSFKKNIKKLLS